MTTTERTTPQDDAGMAARKPYVGKAILWLLTTVVAAVIGAVAGAAVTSYFDRPALSTTVTGLSTSTKYNERFDNNTIVHVSLRDNVFQHLAQISGVKDVAESDIQLSDLIRILKSDQDTIAQTLKDMENLRIALPELTTLLAGSNNEITAEAFFDKWQPVGDFIYRSISDKINRGELKISEGGPYTNEPYLLIQKEKYMTIFDNDDEDQIKFKPEELETYTVFKRGGYRSLTMKPRDEQEQNVARAIARSLKYFDQTTLLKYLDDTKAVLAEIPLYQELQREVDRYLRGYSRWSVTVLVSNSGSHPISISPTAALYINSDGTNEIKGNTVINLESRAENGDLEPVSFEGGHTDVVQFVSTGIVSANNHWTELLSLFDSGARGCFIVLRPQSDFWNSSAELSSSVRVFGSARGAPRLTDKEIADRFAK